MERKSPFYVTSWIAVIDLTTPIYPMPLPCRARVSFSCHLARAEGWSGCHSGFGPPVQIRSWKWWFLKTRIKFIFLVLKKYDKTDNLILKSCHYERKLLLYWRGSKSKRGVPYPTVRQGIWTYESANGYGTHLADFDPVQWGNNFLL